MNNKLPTQKTYTEAVDKDGNRFVGQTTNNKIADGFANIGPNIANSGIDGFQKGASSVPSQAYYEGVFGCLFAILGLFLKFYIWVWRKSKIAGVMLTVVLVIYIGFSFYRETIISYMTPYINQIQAIAFPQFIPILGSITPSSTPTAILTPTPNIPLVPPTKFLGNPSITLKNNHGSADLIVCADNIVGQTVNVLFSRPRKTWHYSQIANSRCIKFIDMDGVGPLYKATTYEARAALNQPPNPDWSSVDCYLGNSNQQGLCNTIRTK